MKQSQNSSDFIHTVTVPEWLTARIGKSLMILLISLEDAFKKVLRVKSLLVINLLLEASHKVTLSMGSLGRFTIDFFHWVFKKLRKAALLLTKAYDFYIFH